MEMVYSVMVPTLLKVGFPLLLLLLSFHVDHGMSSNDYINSRCNVTANYTVGSKFEGNMHGVFKILTKDAPPNRFANVTKGKGSGRVYGLAQCRGDVDQEDCKSCIHNSTLDIVQKYCPNASDAIIWYENCQLRYSDIDFFGHLNVEDSGNWFWINDKVQEPKAFNQKLGSLLKNLTSQATTEPDSKSMFATGNIRFTDQMTIYGLVQCTRDTSLADCSQCLISTISQIPSTCDNAHGCEIATGSCRVRFDTQLFYNSTTTPSPPAPPSNSSLSPSPPPNSSPPSNPSPPSSGASNTTSDKANLSSATSVTLITVFTFALTSTYLLMMPTWL